MSQCPRCDAWLPADERVAICTWCGSEIENGCSIISGAQPWGGLFKTAYRKPDTSCDGVEAHVILRVAWMKPVHGLPHLVQVGLGHSYDATLPLSAIVASYPYSRA